MQGKITGKQLGKRSYLANDARVQFDHKSERIAVTERKSRKSPSMG